MFRIEVITAVVRGKSTDVSEEHISSMFRAEEYAIKETRVK
jgi:hypothetical protein